MTSLALVRQLLSAAGVGGADASDGAHAKYRPDIDGLRAVAVTPVVFFHLNVRLASG